MRQIQILLFGMFWNFFLDIFDPQLIESMDVKPMNMEGQLYTDVRYDFGVVHGSGMLWRKRLFCLF